MSLRVGLSASVAQLVALAHLLLWLSACGIVETAGGGTDDPNGLTARIAGTAVGPDSMPEAAVAILSRVVLAEDGDQIIRVDSVRTGAAGAFRFDRVGEGRYSMEMRSLDGRHAALLAHIDGDGRTNVQLGRIAMSPPATLVGRLDLPASLGQAATVSVPGAGRTATVAADGSYRLDSVPPGEIDLVIRIGRLVNVLPLRLPAEMRGSPVPVAVVALRSPAGGIAPPEAAAGLAATYVAPSTAPVFEERGVTYLMPGVVGGKNANPVFQPWSSGDSTRRLASGTLLVTSDGQAFLGTNDTLLPLAGLSKFGSFADGQVLLLDLLQTVDGAQVVGVLQAPEIGVVLDSAAIHEGVSTITARVDSLRPAGTFADVSDFQARRSGSRELVLGFRHEACADTIVPLFWHVERGEPMVDSTPQPLPEIGVGIALAARQPCAQGVSSRWSSIQVRIDDLPAGGFVLVPVAGGPRIAIPSAVPEPSGILWDFEHAGDPPHIAVPEVDSSSQAAVKRMPTSAGTVLVVNDPGGAPQTPLRIELSDPQGFATSPVSHAISLRARSNRAVSVRVIVESPDSAYRASKDAGGACLGAIVDLGPALDSAGGSPKIELPLGILGVDSIDPAGEGSWTAYRDNVLAKMTGISLIVDDPASSDPLSLEFDDIRFLP